MQSISKGYVIVKIQQLAAPRSQSIPCCRGWYCFRTRDRTYIIQRTTKYIASQRRERGKSCCSKACVWESPIGENPAIITCHGCSSSLSFSLCATSTGGTGDETGDWEEASASVELGWHDNTRRGVVWDTLEWSMACSISRSSIRAARERNFTNMHSHIQMYTL